MDRLLLPSALEGAPRVLTGVATRPATTVTGPTERLRAFGAAIE